MGKRANVFVGALWTRYLKNRIGYATKTGKSPYDLIVLAAAKDGMVKPPSMTPKQWVRLNQDKLRELANAVKREQVAATPNELSALWQSRKVNPATNAFLETYEWRRVRMEALKKYGSRCQCCGATPADGVKMNVDHIKPRKLFPHLALSLDNLQVLCEPCNHGKGNWDMTDWREAEPTPTLNLKDATLKIF
jgi:5-methylcytosine-specific restriction endonuclease McrA